MTILTKPAHHTFAQMPRGVGEESNSTDALDQTQQTRNQIILDSSLIPHDTPDQILLYLDSAAAIFHDLMYVYPNLNETYERNEHRPFPYDATLHGSLYQTQLVTMALQDGHYMDSPVAERQQKSTNAIVNLHRRSM